MRTKLDADDQLLRRSIRAGLAAVAVATALPQSPPVVKRVDHVMFTGGRELSGLVAVLRDKLRLPVVYDGSAQTPPTPFTFVSFGNMCLEVVALARDDRPATGSGTIGNFALQAVDFARTPDALRSRQIDHSPPERQARWTTIGLRGVGLGFFIEYHSGMEERAERFRVTLEEQQGGALGVVRAIEISSRSERIAEVRPAWVRLLGEPVSGDFDLWRVSDLGIRLVGRDDPRANRVILQVVNLNRAATALRQLDIPFTSADGEIRIDSEALFGLRLVLRQN